MNPTKRIAHRDSQLENFHANVYLKHLRDELKDRGYVISGCQSLDEPAARAGARKNDVPYFADPNDLNANADCFMVLAPSNPEVHDDLCQRIFPFGKPTYVDKTFAPDCATARKTSGSAASSTPPASRPRNGVRGVG